VRGVPAAALTVTLVLAACGPGASGPNAATDGTDATEATEAAAGDVEHDATHGTVTGCEPGRLYFEQEGCRPAASIDLEEIVAGGPPPDGIPPIDEPRFGTVDEAATWLEPASPVLVVDVARDVRAYPLAILTWHEIVNDEVGGTPVVVTYCPLCNSALVFERTVEGPDGPEVLDFGTSGRLHRSNLLMYDRQHHELWTQFLGEGVVGVRWLGTRLERLPAWLLGFDELAGLHPDAQVLTRDTGHDRDYGRNPYVGYDRTDRDPFAFTEEPDDRFLPMTRVVGLSEGDAAVAVLLDDLAAQRVRAVTLDDRRLVLLWAPGQASALDRTRIDQGREVGQTAVFDPQLDATTSVSLEPTDQDGRFVDTRSGSTFDLRGRALDGPLEGRQLTPVTHDDTFWFVWVAFRPHTEVVDS
jgi:hypothetical protein